MIDIIFVILNYNLYEETVQCVNSIRKKIDTQNYYIIIVDNASHNGSVERLKDYFEESEDVELITLKENIGFARGNNEGIKAARKLGATFICCLNDDTELISNNIYSTILKKYNEYHPAVIGPAIKQKNGKISSYSEPFPNIDWFENKLSELRNEKYKFSMRRWLALRFSHKRFLALIGYKLLSKWLYGEVKTIEADTLDVVLHGSCVFFTPVFFSALEGFNPSTFLYGEEHFLYADLAINRLHTLYVPSITIYHKQGLSTKKSNKVNLKKSWYFRHNNVLSSMEKLVLYLKENEKAIYYDAESNKIHKS